MTRSLINYNEALRKAGDSIHDLAKSDAVQVFRYRVNQSLLLANMAYRGSSVNVSNKFESFFRMQCEKFILKDSLIYTVVIMELFVIRNSSKRHKQSKYYYHAV